MGTLRPHKHSKFHALLRAIHLAVNIDFALPPAEGPQSARRSHCSRISALPVASTAYHGRPLKHDPDDARQLDLQEILDRGFEYVEWDGR